MVRLFVFLGNHGGQYRGNRHNVAWQFLDSLSQAAGARWERGFKGRWASLETGAGRVWLLKPETYMNLSGDSAAELAKFYKIGPEEVLAVHDELELGFGLFGFKKGGGLGGHNGLRSLRERLGTPDFLRLRFGIGRPNHDDVAGYVLSDFAREERERLDCEVFPAAGKAFSACLDEGFEAAFGKYQKYNALS